MSDLNTAPSGGSEVLPVTSDLQQPATTPVPETVTPPEPDAEKIKAEQERDKQRNRTKDYINRINRENAEMRARLQEVERAQAPQPQSTPPADNGPTLEEFGWDMTQFQQARDQWLADKLKTDWKTEQTRAENERRHQETLAAYNERVAGFAEQHPDFPEVIGSIAYPISDEVTRAILGHPQGPELAYHLGNNPDDAFMLASIAPHLADAAVQRIAARLSAAPADPPLAGLPAPNKPISQAPQPPPKVAGRTVTNPPPEKMTDEEWLRSQRAARGRK